MTKKKSSTPPKEIKSMLDLQPDTANANQQTKRSYYDVSDSQEYSGWGRDIVVDRHGNIIAGNTSTEVVVDRYEGDPPEPIIVQTDGTRPIIHQRIDIDLYDEEDDRGRMMAYYDNASTRHSQWNRQQLQRDLEQGRNLARIFTDEELAKFVGDAESEARPPAPRSLQPKTYKLSVVCRDEDDLSDLANKLMEEGYSVRPVITGG